MSLRLLSPARYSVATDPLRTERKVELLALLLALVLCLQLLYSGARFALATRPAAVAPAADVMVVRKIRPAQSVTLAQSDDIRGRPLFWESRRPAQNRAETGKAPASPGKGGEMKDIKLLGVFGSGATAGVIVRVKDRQRRILLGEELGGWTLEAVQPNEIILAADGKTKKLQLRTLQVVADTAAPVSGDNSPLASQSPQPKSPRPRAQQSTGSGEDELSLGGGSRR